MKNAKLTTLTVLGRPAVIGLIATGLHGWAGSTGLIAAEPAPKPHIDIQYVAPANGTNDSQVLFVKIVASVDATWIPGTPMFSSGQWQEKPKWVHAYICSLDLKTGKRDVLVELPSDFVSRKHSRLPSLSMLFSRNKNVAVIFPGYRGATNDLPLRMDLTSKRSKRFDATIRPSVVWGGGLGLCEFNISPDGDEFAMISGSNILISDFDKAVRTFAVNAEILRLEWHKDRNLIVAETSKDYLLLDPKSLSIVTNFPTVFSWTPEMKQAFGWVWRPQGNGREREGTTGWWQDGEWHYRKRGADFERIMPMSTPSMNAVLRPEEAASLW